jgi:hypothetical protein
MIKRNTWILLVLFAALVGFALFQKYKPPTEEPDEDVTPTATVAPVEFLFPAEEGVVTSILIESKEGEVIGVERGEEGWVVTIPVEANADQGPVEAAASQATALTILSRLKIDPAAAGLESPAYTITVGFTSGKVFTAEIGDETPIGSGYYARKDGGDVLVITKDGLDALLNLLWYSPALATDTPLPSETPTPTQTPSETTTPEATATPTP